ncbi:SsgA family sporulation/cell division regulator [Streptomyces cadmiisoli]|uniref:SsgA family sporulation/cell division regulator n=1 Tax=Streptomyces cadmiisoli TaxID=2184053 RepID=UPI00364E24AE
MAGRESLDTYECWSDDPGDGSRKAEDLQTISLRSRSVTCRMLMRLVKSDRYLCVATRLRYDSVAPCTVSIHFNLHTDNPAEWVVGRELLSAGRYELSGSGDVRVWPSQILDGVVFISLRSGTEIEVLAASARSIEMFLKRTHLLVPPGQEEQHLDMDGVVRQLTNQPL